MFDMNMDGKVDGWDMAMFAAMVDDVEKETNSEFEDEFDFSLEDDEFSDVDEEDTWE